MENGRKNRKEIIIMIKEKNMKRYLEMEIGS